MKKLNFIAFIIIIAAFTFSCQKRDDIQPDVESPIEQEIGVEIATNYLHEFIKTLSPETRNSAPTITITNVEKKTLALDIEESLKTRSDSSEIIENAELYTLSFAMKDQEGFAVVSGDEKVSKLYLYSENGNIADTNEIFGLNQTIQIIDEMFKIDILEAYYGNPDSLEVPLDNISLRATLNNYPLTNLEWDQGRPYNLGSPSTCSSDPNGKGLAGCVPIAVAMAIASMEPNKAVMEHQVNRFNKMTHIFNPSTEGDLVASFVAKIGLLSQAIYKCGATSATMENARKALTHFHIIHELFGGVLETQNTRTCLDRGNPVIAAGDNSNGSFPHVWLIDGGRKDTGTNNYTHYYCNWGYAGKSNALVPVADYRKYTDSKGVIQNLTKNNKNIYCFDAVKF